MREKREQTESAGGEGESDSTVVRASFRFPIKTHPGPLVLMIRKRRSVQAVPKHGPSRQECEVPCQSSCCTSAGSSACGHTSTHIKLVHMQNGSSTSKQNQDACMRQRLKISIRDALLITTYHEMFIYRLYRHGVLRPGDHSNCGACHGIRLRG